jgi:hypothetical protein
MYLDIDNRTGLGTHADVLNNVFHKKTLGGVDYDLALRSVWRLDSGKYAVFIHIAERQDGGGWKAPLSDVNWLNIPDADGRAFTQIELNKTGGGAGGFIPPDAECAVFADNLNEETPGSNCFLGVFTRSLPDPQGVCVWRRKSAMLDSAGW